MLITIGSTKLYTSCSLQDFQAQDLQAWSSQDLEDWADLHTMVKDGSLEIVHRIEERSVASFTVKDPDGSHSFVDRQPVVIRSLEGELEFSGLVDNVHSRAFGGVSRKIWREITAVDEHARIDKRIVRGVWQNTKVGVQVRDLLFEYFAAEGITEGQILDGPDCEEAITNYVPGNEAMDTRVEYTGDYTWFVDYERKLYFIPRSQFIAPWACQRSDILGQPSLEHSSPKYRNRQYIKAGKDKTDPQTELKKGDGATRTWVVAYPIGEQPTIKVNGVEKTVGILAVETGKDFYWNKGQNTFSQDSGQQALTDQDTIEIVYVGLYDTISAVTDAGAVALLQVVEGIGSGLVEHVEEMALDSAEAGIERATALLQHYARQGRIYRYRTKRNDGIAAGQLQKVYNAQLGLSGEEFLITEVRITQRAHIFYRDITCCEGPADESWERIFCRMARRGVGSIAENVSESAGLQGLYEFHKTWLESDNPNLFRTVLPGALPSDEYFPCIDDEDKQLYLVLLDASDNEILRKYHTRQTITADEVHTTIVVAPEEAIGQIAKLALYGGAAASLTAGTGIKLSEWTFSHLKTNLETLLIECYDTKGW